MCFVCVLTASLNEYAMKDWLSVKMGIGMKSCLKSLANQTSHIPSTDVIDPATSLDSIDDRVTSPCFFKAQEMGVSLNVKIHPMVDYLSFRSPTKSMSVKPARL
jgi:hypothetical protein